MNPFENEGNLGILLMYLGVKTILKIEALSKAFQKIIAGKMKKFDFIWQIQILGEFLCKREQDEIGLKKFAFCDEKVAKVYKSEIVERFGIEKFENDFEVFRWMAKR